MKWKIILIAAVIAAILGSFYLGQNRGMKITDAWYKSHMDTTSVVQLDTNKQEAPVHDTVYRDKLKYYPVYIDSEIPEPQIIYRDSIHYVLMEKVIKEYKTEEYFAKISGVDPNLDYIETYNKTITNTVYVPQKIAPKKDYLEFDAEFKYDKMLMAPVTVNIGHRYGPLDVYAGGGYDFITRSATGQVGAKIQIGF